MHKTLERIVADIGNTRIKWGRCDGGRIVERVSLPPDDEPAWSEQRSRWQTTLTRQWILAGVHPKRLDRLKSWLVSQGEDVRVLEKHAQLPLRVALEHPDRAGIDRLLDAVAVNTRRARHSPAVVVDAGTAVTVNWVDSEGTFRGGAILPGLRLMSEALHGHTALLPLVRLDAKPEQSLGLSTTQAITSGVYWAVAGAIRALVEEYARLGDAPEIYVGGGDAPILAPALPERAIVWPEMTLEGIRASVEDAL